MGAVGNKKLQKYNELVIL